MSYKNTSKINEPVTVTDNSDDLTLKGVKYTHPSFGQARFARVSGDRGKLYGSSVNSSNTIDLEINTSECTRDLGRNWYSAKDSIVRVTFTQTQFAELLTNVNCEGVPCTINYRESVGHIKSAEMPSDIEYIKGVINEKVNNQAAKLNALQKEADEILGKKGALKKADKERLKRINQIIANLSSSSLPFYAESARDSIEKATQEAKAEIDAFNTHMVTALGMEVIKNPEILNKLLEVK